MAVVDHRLKLTLEHLLNMGGGFVLDFTNATFADFVENSTGVDPYTEYEGSKARILRQLWADQTDYLFAKLTIDMLEYRQTAEDLGRISPSSDPDRAAADRRRVEEVIARLRPMLEANDPWSRDEAAFLDKDFGTLDLSRVDVPVDFQTVISDRLKEIEICLSNSAPLAVVLLCGSTLEGLLYEVAKNQPAAFNQAATAPRRDGKVQRLPDWTLSQLIVTARELAILGEDVAKFATAVRDFRNYIHPLQQVSDNFRPRRITALLARQVLRASLDDLAAKRPPTSTVTGSQSEGS
ncbi:hypothetical protein ACIA49_38810 [Kribbella sp. NPDC051587]|uniref:hypothetical protein n=1 Tax=Kribbella sp. NPDC051587 TaxID=3364119 RepID=UPI00379E5253